MVLGEDEYGRSGINESSFYKPFATKGPSASSSSINITCVFEAEEERERIAFLPWLNESDEIQLNFIVENKQTPRGHYKRTRWGGISQSGAFEYPLLETLQCIYLPPLRDAESKLVDVRGSRLSRLLKNLHQEELEVSRVNNDKTELENKFDSFYSEISTDDELISGANKLISDQL